MQPPVTCLHRHDGRARMRGHVDLGDDLDEMRGRVTHERHVVVAGQVAAARAVVRAGAELRQQAARLARIVAAARADPGQFGQAGNLDAPALVVRQVQVQAIELVRAHLVDQAAQRRRVLEVACEVDVHPAMREARRILDEHRRDRAAAGRCERVERLHAVVEARAIVALDQHAARPDREPVAARRRDVGRQPARRDGAPHRHARAVEPECRRTFAQRRDLRVRQIGQGELDTAQLERAGQRLLALHARQRAARVGPCGHGRRVARRVVLRVGRQRFDVAQLVVGVVVAEHGGRRALDDHVRARDHVAVAQQPVFGDERQFDAFARCQPHRAGLRCQFVQVAGEPPQREAGAIDSQQAADAVQVELPAAVDDRLVAAVLQDQAARRAGRAVGTEVGARHAGRGRVIVVDGDAQREAVRQPRREIGRRHGWADGTGRRDRRTRRGQRAERDRRQCRDQHAGKQGGQGSAHADS